MKRKKRKRKISALQSPRILEAQQKKDFFNKIKHVLKSAGCSGLFGQLSDIDKMRLFAVRYTPIKIIAGRSDIKAIDLKIFSSGVKEMLISKKHSLGTEAYQVSAYDLLTAGLTLYAYLKGYSDNNPKEYQHLFDQLGPLSKIFEQDKGPFDNEVSSILAMCLINNNITQQLYYTKRVTESKDSKLTSCSTIELFKYIPSRRTVRIDGNSRTTYQVGWFTNDKYIPSIIQSEKIKAKNTFPKKEYKVYVQAHALNRLSERLNEDINGILHIEMFNSILAAKSFTYYRDRIYIDYCYGEHKVGYLIGEIIDGIIVIKTFLFLTHRSTPEGERLKELTGLNKLDMKHLNIDKLKVFQESDIKNNAEIKQIFIDAGCASLFEIRKDEFKNTSHKVADKFIRYLEDTRKDYTSIKELENDMQAEAIDV